jgi:hypothetical protein
MEDIETQYLTELVSRLKAEKFTGSVQINFRLGGISNINKNECIHREDFVVLVKI